MQNSPIFFLYFIIAFASTFVDADDEAAPIKNRPSLNGIEAGEDGGLNEGDATQSEVLSSASIPAGNVPCGEKVTNRVGCLLFWHFLNGLLHL